MKKKRGNNTRSYYIFLAILIIIFIALIFIGVFSDSAKISLKDLGELSALRWTDTGIAIGIERSSNGNLVLSLQSDYVDSNKATRSIRAIELAINLLIDNMRDNGANIRDDTFSIDFSEANKLLTINFDREISDTILNGTILFLEKAAEYCDVELIKDLVAKIEESKVYDVNITEVNCRIEDLPYIFEIISFAEIYANITQIDDFKNLTISKNKNATRVLDLDNYFDYIGECEFKASSEKNNIKVGISTGNFLNLYPNYNWVGKEKINIKLQCNKKEIKDNFYLTVSNKSIANSPPILLESCYNLKLKMNKDYNLDLDNCYRDENYDELTYAYSNVESHLTIKIDNSKLTITPDKDWKGNSFFHISADDLTEKVENKINVLVIGTGEFGSSEEDAEDLLNFNELNSNLFQILNPSPKGTLIALERNEEETFSISNNDYDSIEWHLNGELVEDQDNSYSFKSPNENKYIIKVEIKNNSQSASRTWTIVVKDPIDSKKDVTSSSSGKTFIFFLAGIIGLMAIAVIIIIILNKKKRPTKPIR